MYYAISLGASWVIGVVVWAFRLEGRINTNEQRHLDLKELINTRFDALDRRLERVERTLNGKLVRD
jgi:hypothetical protein